MMVVMSDCVCVCVYLAPMQDFIWNHVLVKYFLTKIQREGAWKGNWRGIGL